jgi:predicted TIM-barrel fold metal-dependent hydrolase
VIPRGDGGEFFVFDCHVHLGESSFVSRYFPGESGFTADGWLATMDEVGIDRSVIFPVVNPHTDYSRDNDRMIEWAQVHPTRLVPFMRIQPYFGDAAVDSVHRYANLGARGIKLHSRADGGFALNDPILIRPLVEAAAEHQLVVLFHTGEMHFAMPGLLWDLALDFPSVRFICGHMGGWDGFTEAVAMAKRVDNVWLDTTLAWPPTLVRHAVEALGSGRLVYGSDSPYIPALAEIEKITRWSGVSEDDAARILGLNLAELLGAD